MNKYPLNTLINLNSENRFEYLNNGKNLYTPKLNASHGVIAFHSLFLNIYLISHHSKIGDKNI